MVDDPRVGEILAAWRARRDGGEHVAPEAVVRAHPELADPLRRAFAALALLDRAAEDLPRPASDASEPDSVVTSDPAGDLPVPDRIGDFRLIRRIGRGATGDVYEAEQGSMRRRVALKILHSATMLNPRAVERFRREAQTAGRLHHTHIVPVHAMGRDRGLSWFAMEKIDGQPLSDVIRDLRRSEARRRGAAGARPSGTAPPADSTGFGSSSDRRAFYQRVARAFAGVADALAAAHAARVVHRDVKPSNLMLDASGCLKLLDFGLARAQEDGDPPLTMTGDVVGTPSYMSPEQVRGGRVDGRTDVYGLGATLYELLTLEPPFRGRDIPECLDRIAKREPVAPRQRAPRIPRDLETIVGKAMEKEAGRRYRGAAEMARDLLLFADGGTILARRVGPVGRAWRAVRRHRARAIVAAALVLAIAGAGTLAVLLSAERAQRQLEADRRRELEYLDLCASAEEATRRGRDPTPGPSSRELYTRAIALAPGRYEAYLGRANCEATRGKDALADLDAASAHGAPPRAVHLARAYVLRDLGEGPAADSELEAAKAHSVEDLHSQFYESQIALERREVEQSLPLLDKVIASAPRSGALRYLAMRSRASVRERAGDWSGALEDLLALRESGDASRIVAVRIARAWRRLKDPVRADAILSELLRGQADEAVLVSWIDLTGFLMQVDEWAWVDAAAAAGLSRHKDAPLLLARRGLALHRTKRRAEGLTLLREAGRLQPEGHEEMGLLGMVLFELGEWTQAVEALGQAMALDKTCASCPTALGNTYRALRKPVEAAAALDEALRRRPHHVPAHVGRGNLIVDAGRAKDALAEFDAALEIRPTDVPALVGKARALRQLDRLDESIPLLERALSLDPKSQMTLQDLGTTFHMQRRFQEAVATFDRALDAGDGRPRPAAISHGRRGMTLYELGKLEDAVAALRRSCELDPTSWETWLNLGMVYLVSDRPKEALEAEDQAISLRGDPPHPYPFVWRAAALLYLGRPQDALASADQAIALREDLALAHWRRGQALMELKQPQDAVSAFQRSVAIESENPGYWTSLGHALSRVGSADASSAYEKALAHGSRDPFALNSVAWELVSREGWTRADAERAVPLASAAAEALPGEAAIWNTLGVARYRAGDPAGAVTALTRSEELGNGGDVIDALFLAMAHHRLGHVEETKRWHEEGVRRLKDAPPDDAFLRALTKEASAELGTPTGIK